MLLGLQIVFGLTIIISRTFSNRRAITAIPKGYLPTRSTDVPKASATSAPAPSLRISLTCLRAARSELTSS